MPNLIRCTASEPQPPLWRLILYIVGIVLSINFLVELTNLLPKNLAAIASILILILTAALCSYIINRKLAKYTYILIENDLVFNKQLGRRENRVLDVKIYDIDWIKPIQEAREKVKYKKTYWLTCKFTGSDIYVGRFMRNNQIYRFVFQPNESLRKELYKQIKQNKK
ncbi:hypothetical protein F8154_02265 [Alkaliphilus pronyensis]|uniref:Uncharacterized protein n=1 Tax=Alkaliphilus pronyensis TaxID=1482732 RepID=A0A6I0F749_9FIRM|nr:hypothetical protein [Alkaliphilus pronyensis]KAB3537825.1 hypothetical protein F8154_02265 [Alkaliphilus pronyensis]